MPRIKARCDLFIAGLVAHAGQVVEASERDAAYLVAIGRAEPSDAEPEAEAPKSKKK